MEKTKRLLLFNRYIFILSIVGTIIAFYVLQSFIRQTSIVCPTSGCELVRKNPLSYPLGIPVPAFGFVGYSFMIILSFLRTIKEDKRLLYGILGISIFGVSFVSWFTATEIFLIKAVCTWCAVSAVIMFIIFILSVKSFSLAKNK